MLPGGRLLTLLLALSASAQEPLRPWVSGVDDARSVVVLSSGGASSLCRDDGEAGDRVAGDHQWACPPLAWDPGHDALGVMIGGGRLVRAQAVDAGLGGAVTLTLSGDRVVVSKGEPPAGEPGVARPPVPALVLDVDRGESRQAWVLEVAAGQSSGQLACHDDGEFPDAGRNDDVPVCAGEGATGTVTLRLRTPSQEAQAVRQVGAEVAVIQGRWTDEGLQEEARTLMPTLTSTARALPSGDALPAPRGGEQSSEGPAVKPQEAPARPGIWAAVLAVLAGLAGWRLGRGPRADRSLHPSLERIAGAAQVHYVESLPEAWARLGPDDPVVVVGGDVLPPATHTGAALRCRSVDVLDVVDAVCGLAGRDPLRSVGLLIGGAETLMHPGGLGVAPMEVLERTLPPGTRCVVVTEVSES